MSDKSTPWRVERNHKMHFRVVRMNEDGVLEVLQGASWRDRSFDTRAGADRACRKANREAQERADNACQICGEDGGTKCGAVNCVY